MGAHGARVSGGEVRPFLVLIGGMPKMLREVVSGLLGAEPDFKVVTQDAQDEAFTECVTRLKPAAVILAHQDSSLPELGRRILMMNPGLRLVVVREDGHRGWIHRMVPANHEIEGLSPDGLVQALRESLCNGSSWDA